MEREGGSENEREREIPRKETKLLSLFLDDPYRLIDTGCVIQSFKKNPILVEFRCLRERKKKKKKRKKKGHPPSLIIPNRNPSQSGAAEKSSDISSLSPSISKPVTHTPRSVLPGFVLYPYQICYTSCMSGLFGCRSVRELEYPCFD